VKPFRRKRRPGNRPMKRDERQRMEGVKSQCIPCLMRGYRYEGVCAEGNHIKRGNLRVGHKATYGLCIWHHRKQLMVEGWSVADHRRELGPSLMDGSKTFHAAFGSDDELLRQQNELLGAA